MTSLSSDLQQARAKNTTDEELLEGMKTALVLKATTSRQCILHFVKECEKLVDKVAIDGEFWMYRLNMDTELGRIQSFLDDEKKGRAKKRKNFSA